MSVHLYVEGGGDSKALRAECRRGFSELLRKAGFGGRMPRIVACGTRRHAFEDFVLACSQPARVVPVLLVDAEEAVRSRRPWEHLLARDGWQQPSGSEADQCHLMVEVMESWFLADPDTVGQYFGRGFQRADLPANPLIEDVPKQDVLQGLHRASRRSSKGPYRKGSHSFRVLGSLDPIKLEDVAPHAKRFFRDLRRILERHR